MGWFTNLYPVVLATPRSAEPVQAALGIRDELRRAAPAARDYGLVRHLHPDPAVRAGVALPHADHVVFNYLGRTGASPKGSGELELSGPLELVRGECAPSFAAEVGAMAVDGQLVVKWTSARTDRAVVEAAAQRMVRHASSIAAELAARTGDATPGDFPLAGLDDTGLAKLADVLEASDGGR